jgi:hypothetical protein
MITLNSSKKRYKESRKKLRKLAQKNVDIQTIDEYKRLENGFR